MRAWSTNIEETTLSNENFRTEIFTGKLLQVTVMTLQPGEEIGLEVHEGTDQFIRIEEGSARADLGASREDLDEHLELADDFAIVIPAGTWHNITNTGAGKLKLYSIYTPPEHPEGTVHKDKAEADAAEAAEHGH